MTDSKKRHEDNRVTSGENAPAETAGQGKKRDGDEKAGVADPPAKETVDKESVQAEGNPPSADSSREGGTQKERTVPVGAAAGNRTKGAAGRTGAAGSRGTGRRQKAEDPPEPSPKQPLLDKIVKRITDQVGAEAVEEAYINRPNGHLPTIVVNNGKWHDVARLLREDESLGFDYLQNLSGVDYEDRMEVVYHLYSFTHRHSLCVRVKTDREDPRVPSTTDIWAAANWNEREVYDLLGIRFPGHPNLKRIFMPEDWVGHPLRKDYEPLDPDI